MCITIVGEALAPIRSVFAMAKSGMGGSALLGSRIYEIVSNMFHSLQAEPDILGPRNYMLIAMTFHLG
jgi:hypothetical protein